MRNKLLYSSILILIIVSCISIFIYSIKNKEHMDNFLDLLVEGNVNKVTELLNNGFDLKKFETQTGINPLVVVSCKGDEGLVALMIEKGCDINSKDENGYSALYFSIMHGFSNTTNTLLKNGASTDFTIDDFPPIIYAAMKGHYEIIPLLLKYGIDINSQHFTGENALHYVVKAYPSKKEVIKMHPQLVANYPKILDFLIKNGTDINRISFEGFTPLDYAIEDNKKEVIDLLKKHGAKTAAELKAEKKTPTTPTKQ